MNKIKNTLFIGIAGGSGSGKTTVSKEILNQVGPDRIAYIPHDAYYKDLTGLPPEVKAQVNFDHPNSLETDLLIKHLTSLSRGEPIELPVYDFSIHSRTEKVVRISPKPVIIVEGILIFSEPELRALFDLKIFVDTDSDIRFIRRLRRDVGERGRTPESVVDQYLSTVRPMHLEFVEPSKRYADIIIPEGGHNVPALELVVARVQDLLSKSNQ
ncbi:MAG TPA: uridine kinase [Anaerolineales bacterium]|nr:uridine kinase [Anaerolineales bacterium]